MHAVLDTLGWERGSGDRARNSKVLDSLSLYRCHRWSSALMFRRHVLLLARNSYLGSLSHSTHCLHNWSILALSLAPEVLSKPAAKLLGFAGGRTFNHGKDSVSVMYLSLRGRVQHSRDAELQKS